MSAGFLFKTYNELVYDYKKCAGKLVTEFSDELGEMLPNQWVCLLRIDSDLHFCLFLLALLGKEWLSKADLDSKLDEFEVSLVSGAGVMLSSRRYSNVCHDGDRRTFKRSAQVKLSPT